MPCGSTLDHRMRTYPQVAQQSLSKADVDQELKDEMANLEVGEELATNLRELAACPRHNAALLRFFERTQEPAQALTGTGALQGLYELHLWVNVPLHLEGPLKGLIRPFRGPYEAL